MGGSKAGSPKEDLPTPGPRSRAAGWGDRNGNFWMFGGLGFDSSNMTTAHITNDLWMFNLTSLKWDAFGESDGGPGTVQNKPAARRGAVACGVHDIIIALYGGEGLDGRMLDDTWIYDIGKKSWLPLYSTGSSIQHHPPGRVSPVVWCLHDSIVIYGGEYNEKLLDDMWQFSLTDLTWTKLLNSSSSLMNPGGRIGATTWIIENKLWMFGGATTPKTNDFQLSSDLWEFSLDTRQWHVLSKGDMKADQVNYDQFLKDVPEPRKFSQGWHSSKSSSLFIYGGEGHTKLSAFSEESQLYDNLWQYDIQQAKWDKIPFFSGETITKHSTSGVPSRSRGNSWVGQQGEFYTFGGLAYDSKGNVIQMNDVWILVPPNTPVPSHFINVSYRTIHYSQNTGKNEQKPGFIFLMVLLTFGGGVMVVGAVFFLKKMSDYPRHHPSNRFKVRYTKLDKNADLEDEAEQFLLQDPDEVRASFTIVE